MTDRTLSSPNRMVWQYAAALRGLAEAVQNTDEGDRQKQGVAVCIFLAVTVVESFINIFFRIQVERPEHRHHRDQILDDFRRRRALDHKVKTWPDLLFGRSWDLSSGSGKRFQELKDRRNALMHSTSSHESVSELAGVLIEGMADTKAFDSLTREDAGKLSA